MMVIHQDDPFFDDVPRVNGGRPRSKRESQHQVQGEDDLLGQQEQQRQHQHQQHHQQQQGRRGRLRASSRQILLEQRGVATTPATTQGKALVVLITNSLRFYQIIACQGGSVRLALFC